MESTVKTKLSLGIFLWSYGITFCHIMCREYDTQCVCQGQLNLIFKNLFVMITEWSPTFSPKPSNNICSQHSAVMFTPLEQFVRRQNVKWRASSLGWHSSNLTCGWHIHTVIYEAMLNVISIHLQLNDQYPILRVHTYLGCINTKYFYTVLCIKMNHTHVF
jgi:hypothetical protein